MADPTLPQCVLAEKEFAVMAGQVANLVKVVDRLNVALMGNGKPGVISELSAIKAHIGFNQSRTLHERMTSIEEFVLEFRKDHDEQKSDLRKIVFPILQNFITFVLGALAYIIITNVIK